MTATQPPKMASIIFGGLVGTDAERTALIDLAEGVAGVVRVADEMIPAHWDNPWQGREDRSPR